MSTNVNTGIEGVTATRTSDAREIRIDVHMNDRFIGSVTRNRREATYFARFLPQPGDRHGGFERFHTRCRTAGFGIEFLVDWERKFR